MSALGSAAAVGSFSSTPISSERSMARLSGGLVSGTSPRWRRSNASQKYASATSRWSASPPFSSTLSSCSTSPSDSANVHPPLPQPIPAPTPTSLRQSSAPPPPPPQNPI